MGPARLFFLFAVCLAGASLSKAAPSHRDLSQDAQESHCGLPQDAQKPHRGLPQDAQESRRGLALDAKELDTGWREAQLRGPLDREPPGISDDDEDDSILPRIFPLPRQPRPEARPAPTPERPAQKKRVEAPPKAPPASAPPRAEQRRAALDVFFEKLKTAEDPGEAAAYALAIRRIWAGAGSDTANLILQRARTARAQGKDVAASRLLDAAAEIAPEWALAHVERGAARLAAGDLQGAQEDFEAAVKSDPRNFEALAQLAAVRIQRNQKPAALEALRAARTLYPANDELKKAEEALRLEVEGRDI